MVTSLKSPSQQTNINQQNNTTAINKSANKNSLQLEFHQPQQHQLQIQINGGDMKRKINVEQSQQSKSNGNIITTQTVGKLLSPPKSVKASQVTLSTTGPITDL